MTAPPTAKLSGAALRKLRGLGHALDAVVAIGKDGMTDALVRAVDTAIGTHELVKVKIQRGAPVDRHEAGIELAARTGSVLAQVLGGTLLLYRRHPKKPKIELTEAKKARSGKTTSQRERKTSGKAVETASDETEDPGDNG